jgi:hypothetical protein
VVALGCNAAGEGGQRGGRNGQRSVVKLSSVLLQNGGKGSGAGGPVWECPRGGGGNKGVRARVARGRTVATASPTAVGAGSCR